MIRSRFSAYRNPPIPRERPEAVVPFHQETIYSTQSDPEATWTAAIIFNKFHHSVIRTEEDYREEIAKELYIRLFNNRLTELLDQPEPPYTYGYVDFTSLTRDKSFHTMTVLTGEEDFYRGYKTLLFEEKKLKEHGFTQTELERAVKELTAEFQNIYDNRNNTESAQIASWYVQNFLDREPVPGISYQYEVFRKYADRITTDEILKLAEKWLTEENRVIYTMNPDKEGLNGIDPVELSRIHYEISRMETTAPEEETVQENLMSELPVPGSIIKRDYIEGPDIYEWELSNGAKVVLKQTDFKENEILFSAMTEGGVSLAEDKDFITATHAAQAVIQSGAGGYDKRVIEKILAGSTATVKPVINELTSGFRGSSGKEDLTDLFQLCYLYFTDPGKDTDLWQSYMTRLGNNLANRDSNPMTQYSDLITYNLYQDHVRSRPLTTERLKEFDLDRALEFYRSQFESAEGFTFFFTGSLSPEELEPYLTAYLAALPSRGSQQSWVDRGVRYPTGIIRDSLKSGIDPVSYVAMIYTGEWEWSDRETEVFQAVTDSMDMILNEELRERASGTYTPESGPIPQRFPTKTTALLYPFHAIRNEPKS